MEHIAQFIELNPLDVTYLLVVGFIGGLVSGFIGSGGAFVLTPAMMSMGVPGIIAVASNICHKFPKALVGAIKRARYGQVDVKLGLVVGVSAEAGVLYGAHIQENIKRAFGDTGSSLYVSVAFVVVLAVVGGYVLWDAWRLRHTAHSGEEKVARLARWVQSVHIPGTMVYFKSLNARVSVLFTIPLGFATGMLAATIAVGGFIGVPGMHYILGAPSLMASATELVVAFVMGLGGTIKYAWSGLVDIRLAMIILAGSLFGIQLGAIGTTYVKPHMIKVVMGTIMILVLLSRAIVIPVYLSDLDLIPRIESHIAGGLKNVSFIILIAALTVGAAIIFSALWRGIRAHRLELAAPVPAMVGAHQLSPVGRFERFLVATDGSEFSAGAVREAIQMARKCGAQLHAVSVVATGNENEALGEQLLRTELDQAQAHVAEVRRQAAAAGLACDTRVLQGTRVHEEIVAEAARVRADLIIVGRRGRHGLAKYVVGDSTLRVIGHAPCSVLVVPRAARIEARHIVVALDGSRHGDAAATAAGNLAKLCHSAVTAVSVMLPTHREQRRRETPEIVQRVVTLLGQIGVQAEGVTAEGRVDSEILDTAARRNADLIVLGSHGRTGFERLLLGGNVERVLDRASSAVLVTKAA